MAKVIDTVRFDCTKQESQLIAIIVKRFLKLAKLPASRSLDLNMDVTACHVNGCKLDLERLAAADDFNLAHDVAGINRHIDRSNGKLMNCFLPRFSCKN